MRKQRRPIQNRAHRHRRGRQSHEEQRPAPTWHLAKYNVGGAMRQEAEEYRLLIIFKSDSLAETIAHEAANQESDARNPPKLPQSLRAAFENKFAEQREQDL